ncbi:unnamed protein product [Plutella xylostella]|uniref:(diamondback moth) hypothetical protein n=1 Tax=Plutella xylostella TaxID=51655 RepID=A0A8S4FZF6_PLUXY|nr:unnamed protein product [Plutella xylostella]
MKELLLLVLGCYSAMAAAPCCDNSVPIRVGGYCGDGDLKINIKCPFGYVPLKDIVIKGDQLYTMDAPNFSFASDPKDYCVGEMLRNRSDPAAGRVSVAIVCFQQEYSENKDIEVTGILTLVSVAFLALTFAVYMFLPQLRDLQGLCYMCLCLSMALGFLSLGILQLNPNFTQEICTVTGFLVYFWMMATFFWTNVICINVYRTVVNSAHLKKTERRQYFIYSCYAWGCTFLFLVVSLITNFIEGDHLKPGIGVNSCWFKDRTTTWVFFYGPVAILLTANVALFILSSLNLWKHTRKYEVSKLNNLKYRFLLSLKLLLVMGISWVFEIASFAHGESHIVWKIMDTFNCLQGVVIFLILVVLRRRAVRGLAAANLCLPVTRGLADKLSPHDDSDDQQILGDEHTEVRLN